MVFSLREFLFSFAGIYGVYVRGGGNPSDVRKKTFFSEKSSLIATDLSLQKHQILQKYVTTVMETR